MKRLALALVFSVFVAAAHAGDGRLTNKVSAQAAKPAQLTAKQRGAVARMLVEKWAADVQRRGGDVQQWAVKLGRYVGIADIANLSRALDMPTFPAMMAALQGQPADSRSMRKALTQGGDVGIESIGSAIADTTYTPLASGRCRIADSRVIASPLTPFVERPLDVEDVASYAAQGGSGSTAGNSSDKCGIPSFVTAYAVSLTVLPPAGTPSGLLKLYENGKSWTEGNPVLFTLNDFGASNDMIVSACQSCSVELAIQSGSAVHYVVDIVGYFSPPLATALECTETYGSQAVPPDSIFEFQLPNCPTGYTLTGAGCRAGPGQDVRWGTNGLNRAAPGVVNAWCTGKNIQTYSIGVDGTAVCCRLPGR